MPSTITLVLHLYEKTWNDNSNFTCSFFRLSFLLCVIRLCLSNIMIISQERFKYSVHIIPERETFDQVS